jgi:hypothetical protein
MSKYGWEAGTIKLSTAEFPKVRTAIWEAANAERAARLARALELWAGAESRDAQRGAGQDGARRGPARGALPEAPHRRDRHGPLGD